MVSNIVHLKCDLLRDFLVQKLLFLKGGLLYFVIMLHTSFMAFSLQIYERLQENHSSESMKLNIQFFIGLLTSNTEKANVIK